MAADLREVDRATASRLIKEISPEADVSEILSRTFRFWAGWIDGRITCVLGIITPNLLSPEAYLWLHHSDTEVYNHRLTFLRNSRRFIGNLLEVYGSIRGHTTTDAKPWLQWLGAEITDDGEYPTFEIRTQHG